MIDGIMGIQMAQLQTNYTYGLMKMSMDSMESQAQQMLEMLPNMPAPAQYSFDVWA